ncbi:MAG TPA: M20/M25/M40 family metallo-hydrolase [Clostridia bacterium]|nr:M20/M25/M40 family metallo-hydrolase [Clostridia bacterium]
MNSQRLIERFFKYVKTPSESGSEGVFCKLLEEELLSLGLVVERDCVGDLCGSDGWNIYARLDGVGDAILFSAHTDTVSPGIGIQPIIEQGIIKSSGNTILGADDKAGIAAVTEALNSIIEQGKEHRTIEVLFSVCEEPGLLGAKHADYSKIKSRRAVVLDNENLGEIINRNAANMTLRFKVFGKAAHAGMAPQEGVHALKAAANAVAHIPVGYVDDISVMNISNFCSPGKTNVVADKASFDMEIRSFEEERLQEHITACERAVKKACESLGASFEMSTQRHSGVTHVPENAALITEIKAKLAQLSVECKIKKSFGGSDATHFFAHGFEVVNLGIGMQSVHSCEEHISVSDLETTARLVESLMEPLR